MAENTDWQNPEVTTIRELFEWAEEKGLADKELWVEATTAGGYDFGAGPVRVIFFDESRGIVTLINDDC